MSNITAIRGMNDILPDETPYWQYLEQSIARVLASYGYNEIRFPVVEKTELFKRNLGEATDIVEKEMYTFEDRNGESLTLRPEGTAGCVRAAIQQSLLNVPRRLWYAGPMFRYERPQKGRQRQFHQIGVESFGVATPDMDAEMILMSARLWRQLGVADSVELQLNSIGSTVARKAYRSALVAYLEQHVEALDEDSQRRLHTNPLRILDSKNPAIQELLNAAPRMDEYLDEESRADFARLCQLLQAAGIPYVVNTRLVRGLDYYNKTVFEWITDRLGAQGTICAGGRYDALVQQMGGKDTPGIGFAMGMERLVLLLIELGVMAEPQAMTDVYVVAVGDQAQLVAMSMTEQLRDLLPTLNVVVHAGGGSFKSQMKKADKSGAGVALIWGEDEVAARTVSVKPLRASGVEGERVVQQTVPVEELEATLCAVLAG